MENKKSKKEQAPIVIPFGKYKNREVSQILEFDPKYCQWLLRQEWLSKFTHLHEVLTKHFQNHTE
jgi:uncharacterized protein (DUF3820 family)